MAHPSIVAKAQRCGASSQVRPGASLNFSVTPADDSSGGVPLPLSRLWL
jgi:hypothetical protein